MTSPLTTSSSSPADCSDFIAESDSHSAIETVIQGMLVIVSFRIKEIKQPSLQN